MANNHIQRSLFFVATLLVVGCSSGTVPGASKAEDFYVYQCDPEFRLELPKPANPDDPKYKASREAADKLTKQAQENTKNGPEAIKPDDGRNLKWEIEGLVFEAKDAELTLNGKKYGSVKPDDKIKVTHDGKLFVNGDERKSES